MDELSNYPYEEIRGAMFKLNQRGFLLGKIPLNVEIQTEI